MVVTESTAVKTVESEWLRRCGQHWCTPLLRATCFG